MFAAKTLVLAAILSVGVLASPQTTGERAPAELRTDPTLTAVAVVRPQHLVAHRAARLHLRLAAVEAPAHHDQPPDDEGQDQEDHELADGSH